MAALVSVAQILRGSLMPFTDFKQPSIPLFQRVVSHTGRYMGFYGMHYHEGKTCYVVGVSDQALETITERHYNEKTCVNFEAAKWAASKYWEETLKPGLERAPERDADSDVTSELESWFERYDDELAKRKRKEVRRLQ